MCILEFNFIYVYNICSVCADKYIYYSTLFPSCFLYFCFAYYMIFSLFSYIFVCTSLAEHTMFYTHPILDNNNGVQRRMISVVNFFVFLRLH